MHYGLVVGIDQDAITAAFVLGLIWLVLSLMLGVVAWRGSGVGAWSVAAIGIAFQLITVVMCIAEGLFPIAAIAVLFVGLGVVAIRRLQRMVLEMATRSPPRSGFRPGAAPG